MMTIHKEVRQDMEWNKKMIKSYYDKKRVEMFSLKEGDKVYLRRRTVGEKEFNIKTSRISQKLDCVKIGPYRVKRKLDKDNYELDLPERMRIHPIFYISLLSKTDNPTSNQDEGVINEYEVEEIIAPRRLQNSIEVESRKIAKIIEKLFKTKNARLKLIDASQQLFIRYIGLLRV